MRTRLDMWEALAISAASNPRIRTGKQAKIVIDFLLGEREKVIREEEQKRAEQLMSPSRHRGVDHEPQPDGSCSCQRRV